MAIQRQAEGLAVGRAKARRLMQDAGLAVRRRTRRGPVTTASQHRYPVASNLLARQFEVEKPDHVRVRDMTSVGITAGWLSVAVRLDWHSRRVVGWATSAHIDPALVQEALRMALERLHPSNRGSPYAGYDD